MDLAKEAIKHRNGNDEAKYMPLGRLLIRDGTSSYIPPYIYFFNPTYFMIRIDLMMRRRLGKGF
jgi:hypothetical protein